MAIVRVALPVPLPRAFDYLADDASPADLGRCVRVPFGKGEKTGVIVELPQDGQAHPGTLREVRAVLRELPPLPPDWLRLARFASAYYQAPLGEVVSASLPPALRRAALIPLRDPTAGWPLVLTESGRAMLGAPGRAGVARRILQCLADNGPRTRAALREQFAGSASVGRAIGDLLAAGAICPVAPPPAAPPDLPALLAAQTAAVGAIAAALGGYAAFLLHGVTGSGKTEVYLRLIDRVLARGQQALLLVPEIGLTPQLEGRVAQRFPDALVVSLHSGQSDGARSRGFVQALTGAADIVLGTRLAVFTPLPRLGLIVVDEEQDASFKQQDGVRYSARDLAVWRAHDLGVPVVLGSATPSLESWQAARRGRYRLIDLPERALAAAMPAVRLVDTRRVKLDNGLSPALIEGLTARLARGEQSLVFLNRRGYAPVLCCAACGWVSACTACSANRVYHAADRRLRCHHCGAEAAVPQHCPSCGNQDLQPFGRGTQRLEARLDELFPSARVLRVDRDAARTPALWAQMLERIHNHEADILVGTQMLAKGHDFARLTLVGVVGADASLFAADFRAAERLFAQLMQVGGRSGRADLPGEVLVQTDYPHHPLYQSLQAHDYAGFANTQLAERRAAGFPPFAAHAILRAEAPQLAQSLDFLRRAASAAGPLPDTVVFYDVVPMRLARRANLERAQLLLESSSRTALQALLAAWLPQLYALKAPRDLYWHVEVDPLEL
ncbi:MAG: primosomal protein N' [Sterolibacteriaceae bacterium]|nr:primosomal protein N' [Candidatus Methylophosphatis haderslevensis]